MANHIALYNPMILISVGVEKSNDERRLFNLSVFIFNLLKDLENVYLNMKIVRVNYKSRK